MIKISKSNSYAAYMMCCVDINMRIRFRHGKREEIHGYIEN